MNAVLNMLHLCLNLSSFTIIASMKQQIWLFSLASQIAHIMFNVTVLLLRCMQKSHG